MICVGVGVVCFIIVFSEKVVFIIRNDLIKVIVIKCLFFFDD